MGMAAWQDLTCARLFLHLAVPPKLVSHPHGYFSVYGVSMDAIEATTQIIVAMSSRERTAITSPSDASKAFAEIYAAVISALRAADK